MKFFVEDGLDYSDYGKNIHLSLTYNDLAKLLSTGVNALHLPHIAVRGLFSSLYESVADSVITTRNVSGTVDGSFVAWELDWSGKYIKDLPGWPKAQGQRLSLVGVSLQWWTPAAQVERECDYVSIRLIDEGGHETKV